MPGEVHTRDMAPQDWPDVRRVYEQGIATSNATFETEAPEWDAWDRGHLARPRLVATLGDGLVGWCALSPVSSRRVYRGVVEVSTYVGEDARGRGVGRALLTRMIERCERAGIWTLQAGVFPENVASLSLHARCGFRTVGVRERIGRLDGVWRDVVLLERRSDSVEDGGD
jgi:L-amino acid N-acyltransferase YncA